MRKNPEPVAAHFEGRSSSVRRIYDRLLDAAGRFGPVGEEAKKTSIHLTRRTAFAGVATRRKFLVLTLKSDKDIASACIGRRERASANRWHLEVKLQDPREVDRELVEWLRQAYALSA